MPRLPSAAVGTHPSIPVTDVGADPKLQWVVVRPDTLTEGEVAEYQVHDGIVASLFRPDMTRMAEVAHFMCELATDQGAWQRWRGRGDIRVDDNAAGKDAWGRQPE